MNSDLWKMDVGAQQISSYTKLEWTIYDNPVNTTHTNEYKL
jgi:hypothetical protein